MTRCRCATTSVSVIVVLIVLCAAPVRAADTGTLSGTVVDATGAPAVEVTVTVAGSLLPAGRSVLSDSNGAYRFEYLPAGDYSIRFEKPGAGAASRIAIVEVGKDTQVDMVVGVAVAEQLVVAAITPMVDVRSTEASFNVTADNFNSLPIERTYRGLFQLMPGVADNRSSLGPAAGGNRQDNLYLIDGTNITNPGFGYLSLEVNVIDVAEVNLKRAGITAEFGRASGSVTNAVTRSGSNRFAGIGRLDWLNQRLVSAYALPDTLTRLGIRPGTFRDSQLTSDMAPAIGIGGPVLRDRMFFYASGRYSRQTKWGRVNKVGTPLPDEVREGQDYYGKLTAVPSASHQLNAGLRVRPAHVENYALDSNSAPSTATRTDNGSHIASAEWTTFLTPRSAVDVRYLRMDEDNEDTPITNLGIQPAFNPANLAAMGQYNDPTQADLKIGGNQFTAIQNYLRQEVRGTYSHFFALAGSSHAFKAGAGYELAEETFNRIGNGWGLIQNVTQSGVPVLRARYFLPQAPQVGQGRTYALFVQDNASFGNRVSLNLGLLVNRDEFAQRLRGSRGCPAAIALKGGAAVYESRGDTCTFLRFGFGDEMQPRLGVSYNVRDGRSDKAYANWGRYYNMDQKSASRSLAPNRIFQTQTIFDLSGRALSTDPLASTTGKLIDPAIKPIYSDELLFGYATPIAGVYSLDLSFVSRKMHQFIEDVPSRMNGTAPDSGPFVATNLPCTTFAACRSANAQRTYRAFTADFRRRLLNGWMSDVSYTWSRFEGNFDLDYSATSVFNTSSFIQDAPGTNVEDPNRFGPLFEDRPHVFKVFTSYAATPSLIVSGYLRVQSGAPWAARGRDWAGPVLNYLEPAGSHRNPTWTNLDALVRYRLPLRGRANVSAEARVLNVFNNQTQLSTDSQQFLDLRTLPAPPYFAPYLQPNPFFATGNGFAPPRRLHLAALVSF